jgi:diacylglycerol kinase (ATP)
MRLKLIHNPAAGRGRAQRRAREVESHLRALGADVDIHASSSPADLTRVAAESSRGPYDRVVICGGDGTVNLAIREFDLQRGTLAIIPLGSGDDFARVLGIPREVRAACQLAVSGNARPVDIALANNLRYAGVAGLGFDSEVARYANERVQWLRGSAVYLYAILRVLPRFRPLRVSIDGRPEEVMFAVFANSSQYGSGIRIAPDASITDGRLDACIVHRTSRLQLLKTLPQAYTGTHVRSRFVETRRAEVFRVDADPPLDVYADGERLTETPVTFRIASDKLRVVGPSR